MALKIHSVESHNEKLKDPQKHNKIPDERCIPIPDLTPPQLPKKARYFCLECGEDSFKWKMLKKHMLTSHNEDLIGNEENLKKHRMTIDGNSKSYIEVNLDEAIVLDRAQFDEWAKKNEEVQLDPEDELDNEFAETQAQLDKWGVNCEEVLSDSEDDYLTEAMLDELECRSRSFDQKPVAEV